MDLRHLAPKKYASQCFLLSLQLLCSMWLSGLALLGTTIRVRIELKLSIGVWKICSMHKSPASAISFLSVINFCGCVLLNNRLWVFKSEILVDFIVFNGVFG